MKKLTTALICLLLCLPCAALGEDFLVSDTAAASGVAVTTENAALRAAVDALNAGSLLDALNAFAKFGTKEGADKYYAYTQALLSIRRDDPATALATLQGLDGFLDSAYRLALTQASQAHRYAQDGKFGFVDASGAWKVPPQFDWAERVFRLDSARAHDPNTGEYKPDDLDMVAEVFNGTTEVSETDTVPLEGKYGLVRTDGTLVAPVQYSAVLWAVNGVAATRDSAGAYLFDIATGKPIEGTFEDVGAYQKGYVTVRKNGLWGYLNPETGAYLGDGCVWESALPFSEGMAGVSQKGLFGFINRDGAVAVPLGYAQVAPFSEGLAGVRVQNRWGFINAAGEVVVKPGYASAKTFQGGVCAVEKGEAWGLINTKGEVILRLKYSEIGDFDPIYHRAWIRQNKLWGLVSTGGVVVLKPTWGAHDEFNGNTLCRVEYRKTYGFVDANGKTRIVNEYADASPFRADYAAVEEVSGQIRYVSKTLRSFAVSTTVPVECLRGFIEGRTVTQTERVETDALGVATTVFDRHIAYSLYDAQGNPITVAAYDVTPG